MNLHALHATGVTMTILTVRGLDPVVQARLREQAARNGRSMEAEARSLLSAAILREEDAVDLAAIIDRHFADAPGGVEVPERTEFQRPVDLSA